MKLLFKFTSLLFLILALNSCSKSNKGGNQEIQPTQTTNSSSDSNKVVNQEKQPAQTTKNRLVGCWKHEDKIIMTLKEDGTLITNSTDGNGTWRLIGDNRLIFNYSDGNSDTHTIVALEDDLMIIKFNGILEFTWPRVKCE
jgi:hypothetical protein